MVMSRAFVSMIAPPAWTTAESRPCIKVRLLAFAASGVERGHLLGLTTRGRHAEERAIRASGTVAGATILGGALGSLAGPMGTFIGAGLGAAGGIAISVVSASRSDTQTSD